MKVNLAYQFGNVNELLNFCQQIKDKNGKDVQDVLFHENFTEKYVQLGSAKSYKDIRMAEDDFVDRDFGTAQDKYWLQLGVELPEEAVSEDKHGFTAIPESANIDLKDVSIPGGFIVTKYPVDYEVVNIKSYKSRYGMNDVMNFYGAVLLEEIKDKEKKLTDITKEVNKRSKSIMRFIKSKKREEFRELKTEKKELESKINEMNETLESIGFEKPGQKADIKPKL